MEGGTSSMTADHSTPPAYWAHPWRRSVIPPHPHGPCHPLCCRSSQGQTCHRSSTTDTRVPVGHASCVADVHTSHHRTVSWGESKHSKGFSPWEELHFEVLLQGRVYSQDHTPIRWLAHESWSNHVATHPGASGRYSWKKIIRKRPIALREYIEGMVHLCGGDLRLFLWCFLRGAHEMQMLSIKNFIDLRIILRSVHRVQKMNL